LAITGPLWKFFVHAYAGRLKSPAVVFVCILRRCSGNNIAKTTVASDFVLTTNDPARQHPHPPELAVTGPLWTKFYARIRALVLAAALLSELSV
jgi:hypothetical protein